MAGVKTFVVRLFVPGGLEGPSGVLRGVVEDVTGGRRGTFADGEELLALLTRLSSGPGRDRPESAVQLMLGSEER